MVAECRRRLLTDDIRYQLQAVYGLQPDGTALRLAGLGHLDEEGREVARELREWQEHLASTEIGTEPQKRTAALERVAHETAFTVLNRLTLSLSINNQRSLRFGANSRNGWFHTSGVVL